MKTYVLFLQGKNYKRTVIFLQGKLQKKMASSSETNNSTKQVKDGEYTEEQYRIMMKNNKRLKNNTRPVCTDRQSYELIMVRRASDTKRLFFECEICGRVTTDYANLNKHCRLHTGDKRFKCCVCGKAFTDSSNRNTHCLDHNKDYFRQHNNNCDAPCLGHNKEHIVQ